MTPYLELLITLFCQYFIYILFMLYRKLKSGETEEADPGSLEGYVDGLFFNKDQSNLQEMIDIIPQSTVPLYFILG